MSDAPAPAPDSPAVADPRGTVPAEATGPEPSFEEATRRLSLIVTELEGGDLPLDRSLALFEEGVRLARAAEVRLDRAERRVEELLSIDAQGQAVVKDFEG